MLEFEDLKASLEAKGKEVADTEALINSTATAISNQIDIVDVAIEAADRVVSIALYDIVSDENTCMS